MEQLIFWGKFLGSIILIIPVLLILGHFYIEIKVMVSPELGKDLKLSLRRELMVLKEKRE